MLFLTLYGAIVATISSLHCQRKPLLKMYLFYIKDKTTFVNVKYVMARNSYFSLFSLFIKICVHFKQKIHESVL